MRRRALPFALMLALAPPALAQPVPTTLHLSESAEVTRAPDEVRATLRAEARGASAAAAQEAVNRAMTAALDRARAVPGVQASTGAYWTHRVEENRGWQAAQTLNLRAREPAPLLELIGALQGQGLALNGIQHGLTRDAAQAARQEAEGLALDALRRRAEAVAARLGMTVQSIREIRMDGADRPMPRPMEMAAARAASGPPPVSVPEEVRVTAAVEGVLVLVPR